MENVLVGPRPLLMWVGSVQLYSLYILFIFLLFLCDFSFTVMCLFVKLCFSMCICLSKECLPLAAFKGLIVLQKVLDTAAERNWLVTSVNVETMTEASFLKVFQDLDKRKEGQIIIDCEPDRLSSILKKVIIHSLLLAGRGTYVPTLVTC